MRRDAAMADAAASQASARSAASTASAAPGDLSTLRRFLLALLVFGIAGSALELWLLEHHEDGWQLVPLVLEVVALAMIGLHVTIGGAGTLRGLQAVMALFVVAGVAGIVLHYKGNLGFQLDMDPTLPRWELFKRVMHAKAPPALAPGLMAQLGLLGLAYCYRHPAVSRQSTQVQGGN